MHRRCKTWGVYIKTATCRGFHNIPIAASHTGICPKRQKFEYPRTGICILNKTILPTHPRKVRGRLGKAVVRSPSGGRPDMIRLRLHKSPDTLIRQSRSQSGMLPARPGQRGAHPVAAIPIDSTRIQSLHDRFRPLIAL